MHSWFIEPDSKAKILEPTSMTNGQAYTNGMKTKITNGTAVVGAKETVSAGGSL